MSEETKEKKSKAPKNIGRTECYTSAQTMAYRQQAAVPAKFLPNKRKVLDPE
jgi:hypothetical protein